MKEKVWRTFILMASGLVGGALSPWLIGVPKLMAAYYNNMVGGKLEVRSQSGAIAADVYVPERAGGIMDFYDSHEKLRLQAGSYPTGGEAGQPFLGLSDRDSHIKMLLRIYGADDSGYLIFKDKAGRDRIVLGLDANEEPFMTVIDKSGRSKNFLSR